MSNCHRFFRKKNTILQIADNNVLYFTLTQYSATNALPLDFNAAAVLAAGDWKVSIDGAAFANTTTTTPTNVGRGVYYIPLTAAEMNGNIITVVGSDQTVPHNWNDVCLIVETQKFLTEWDVAEGTEAVNADLLYDGTMTFRKIFQFVKAWMLCKNTQTSTSHVAYKSDSSTVLFTQAVSDDTITQTQSKAS